jgi:hypothetical protein
MNDLRYSYWLKFYSWVHLSLRWFFLHNSFKISFCWILLPYTVYINSGHNMTYHTGFPQALWRLTFIQNIFTSLQSMPSHAWNKPWSPWCKLPNTITRSKIKIEGACRCMEFDRPGFSSQHYSLLAGWPHVFLASLNFSFHSWVYTMTTLQCPYDK